QILDFQKDLLSIVMSEPDDKLATEKIGKMLEKRRSALNAEEQKQFARVEADVKAQVPVMLSPWYRYFLAYDPRTALERVKVPVLALNGESDLQVSYKENLS